MKSDLIQASHPTRAELQEVLREIEATPWPEEIREARLLYDSQGPPVAEDIPAIEMMLGGVQTICYVPPEEQGGRAVLFLHGGGYVYGSSKSHGGLAAEVARAARCRTYLPEYRLAPEHPFPAAVEDACAACEALLSSAGVSANGLCIAGDSAGGGLALATVSRWRELSGRLPGAVLCISPWVDLLAQGDSYQSRAALDPMIDRSLVEMLVPLYARDVDPRDPLVSPLQADFSGFPPIMIQVGQREVLFSEAESLADKASRAGVDVVFQEWEEMVHVWHLYFPRLRAGRDAIAEVGGFVFRHTQIKDEWLSDTLVEIHRVPRHTRGPSAVLPDRRNTA